MKLFISRLRELIESRDMTQKELANAIDVTEVTISRYLSGDRKPRVDIINKIARYFNVTTDYLVGGDSEIKEKKYIDHYEVPEEFIDPNEAKIYIAKHKMFGSNQLDLGLLDDDEILEFANAMLEQIKIVSYKFKK